MNQYLHGYIKRSGFHHGIGLLIMIVVGLGIFGWFMSMNLARVVVDGALDAAPDDLLALADLEIGQKMYNIDATLLSERVEAHPWVETAYVSRFPNGTLKIMIEERIPELLVLDTSGRPSIYLDRWGRHMPAQDATYHDVPIFQGYDMTDAENGYVSHSVVNELLIALADNMTETDNLISEVSLETDQIGLRLEPVGSHGAVPVQMGSTEFVKKFKRLRTFWYMNMVPNQDTRFESLDLRYDSQIVARETTP